MKKIYIGIISLILLTGGALTYVYFNPLVLFPIPSENNSIKINQKLEFLSLSSKRIVLASTEDNSIIVPESIEKFYMDNSFLYLVQKPTKENLRFTINDNDEMTFNENEIYFWIINLKNNYVEGVYTEKEFIKKYSEVNKNLEFKEIKF